MALAPPSQSPEGLELREKNESDPAIVYMAAPNLTGVNDGKELRSGHRSP